MLKFIVIAGIKARDIYRTYKVSYGILELLKNIIFNISVGRTTQILILGGKPIFISSIKCRRMRNKFFVFFLSRDTF